MRSANHPSGNGTYEDNSDQSLCHDTVLGDGNDGLDSRIVKVAKKNSPDTRANRLAQPISARSPFLRRNGARAMWNAAAMGMKSIQMGMAFPLVHVEQAERRQDKLRCRERLQLIHCPDRSSRGPAHFRVPEHDVMRSSVRGDRSVQRSQVRS